MGNGNGSLGPFVLLRVASPRVKLRVTVRFRGRPPQGFMRQMLSGWKKSEVRAAREEQLARAARADADDPSDPNAKKVQLH